MAYHLYDSPKRRLSAMPLKTGGAGTSGWSSETNSSVSYALHPETGVMIKYSRSFNIAAEGAQEKLAVYLSEHPDAKLKAVVSKLEICG